MLFVVILVLTAYTCVTVDCATVCPLPDPPAKEDICRGQCTGNDVYCQPSADSTSFTCQCRLGYRYDSGSGTCKDVDECAEGLHDCDLAFRAKCDNTVGSYTCRCNTPLFEGDGHLCNKVDDNKCTKKCPDTRYCLHAEFRTPFGTFSADTCICQTGYKTSHIGCVDIDECTSKCDGKQAVCENMSPGYTCRCKPGYEGNGVHCQDVNECLTNNGGCDVNADCANTEGSYSCQCKYGYTGDGISCSALCPSECDNFLAEKATHVPDVDECATEGQTLCPTDAVCVNTIGSYYCRCSTGYQWDDQTKSCVDIDECALGTHACTDTWMAVCTNVPGSYSCKCKEAFDGDGHYCSMPGKSDCEVKCSPEKEFCYDIILGPIKKEMCLCQFGFISTVDGCMDVRECSDNPYPCDPNAACEELSPSFMCSCKDGYEGDGFSCRDMDECAPGGTNTCGEYTDCINTDGSYKCVCQYGYTGDGATCTPICPGPTKPPSGAVIPP